MGRVGGCLGGTPQSYLQTCRHVCCILIMLKPHRHCMNPHMLERGESARCGDGEH